MRRYCQMIYLQNIARKKRKKIGLYTYTRKNIIKTSIHIPDLIKNRAPYL